MRDEIRLLFSASGPLGLLLLVAAVAMCGLSLMDRALISLEQSGELPSIGEVTAVPSAADSRPADGNMAHNGRPAHWPSNPVLTPLIPKTDQTESRIRYKPEMSSGALVSLEADPSRAAQITSASAVSSSLGRQHTLVGARPSGTS